MTTPLPRECEISRYRHGCDPPGKPKPVSPSDCKRFNSVSPPTSGNLSGFNAILDSINTITAIALSPVLSISSEAKKVERRAFMSSTITLVIPWAEKESVFLQRAVQAAIRAHRGDHPWSHDVMADTANEDCSRAFPVAV